MRLKGIAILGFVSCLLFTSCAEHLVSDKTKRSEIHQKFEQRSKDLLHNRQAQLLDVFNSNLTQKEVDALEFLYAYETLSDLCNYDSEHYLQQVRYAFKAQETFSWGKKVSEDDFLHFVLPPRAGTENMDSARVVIFHELKDRLMNLSMKEAAQEVNHWCHEKVTYTGTDGRTSAPLACIRNAKGRCGEESVLTVTALRAVGIPARQIYTPRWVHQDDNHAWVEFWADGKWYFTGACEPEAEVNQGWFVEPSRRAILTATQTLGHYNASDVIYERDNFTRLNQIANYASAKNIFVKVKNAQNKPIEEVEVGFLVCNYAELYNLASLKTDAQGICSLKLGLGDVVVWATKNEEFSFKKISVADTDTLSLVLNGSDFSERVIDFDLVPPVKKAPLKFSAEGREKNKKRLAVEDSIRKAYEKTFMNQEEAFLLASKEQLDSTLVWQKIKKSRGNWANISRLIQNTPSEMKKWVFPLLNAISEKDLRDASSDILLSHMMHSSAFEKQCSEKEYADYILNPRIAMEQLSAYKAYLKTSFDDEFWTEVKKNPAKAEEWILSTINISKAENYIWVPSTPKGVFEMKTTDLGSAKVLFVALCRTAGIPARIDRVTQIAQYKKDEQWVNVYLGEKQAEKEDHFGSISLHTSSDEVCKYAKQFSLAKFENGFYKTLEFPFNKDVKDFPKNISLAVGNYLLLTAERENDGTVLNRLSFFTVKKDEHKQIELSIRSEVKPLEAYGKYFLPNNLKAIDGQPELFESCSLNRGMVVIWIDPDKEPTKHVLKDLEEVKDSFDELSIPFVFVLPQDVRAEQFEASDYSLPENSHFVMGDELLPNFEKTLGKNFHQQLPVVTFLTTNNEVFFLSSGYKIGVGDELLKSIK
ncbi:transglutaminase domain-containing protein [Labilibaculum sp.]|uniref:transglutaminase domain-containing protein n=1 Tax=Labilibaculum sp. TaxID=2060723 RepID=UPI0035635F0E